jgi:hypothetical protein
VRLFQNFSFGAAFKKPSFVGLLVRRLLVRGLWPEKPHAWSKTMRFSAQSISFGTGSDNPILTSWNNEPRIVRLDLGYFFDEATRRVDIPGVLVVYWVSWHRGFAGLLS